MPNALVEDDFYPKLSIRRNLHRSPSSLVHLYENLLRKEEFSTSESNLKTLLYASRELYSFLSEEGKEDLQEYRSDSASVGRPIRGAVVIQFDLVYEILSQILKYVHDHPRESIQTAANLVVIEQLLEAKLGKAAGRLWRKIARKRSGAPSKKEVSRLSRLKRRSGHRPKKRLQKKTTQRYVA